MRLFAPGKVFLAGEYAVLDGEPALVAAVDRGLHAEKEPAPAIELVHAPSGARAQLTGPVPEELRFAARATALAVARYAPSPYRLTFLDDLAVSGRKLGLGGSAAATALAVRAASDEPAEALLPLAVSAHWLEQGGSGSGADVAACLLGGVVEARSVPGTPPTVEATRVKVPSDLRLLLAFGGESADTRALIGEVKLFAAGEPAKWRRIRGAIAAAEAALRESLEGGRRSEALDAVRAGAAAMARLGEAAAVPIVTAPLERACAVAASLGAAGKPSGAGGGDCAVVLCFGDAQRDEVASALGKELFVLSVGIAG